MRMGTVILWGLLTLLQSPPVLGGSLSGVLRSLDGKPVSGVRVAAMTAPLPNTTSGEPGVLVSITQTDQSGRFHLEDVPPGRYHITAGRVTVPTFYPGVAAAASATAVSVVVGTKLDGLDFIIAESSTGPAPVVSFSPTFIDVRGRILL